MNETLAAVEAAMATVQRTIDALNSRGNEAAAFDLAKVQFAASMRASWPGNMSKVIAELERVRGDAALKLNDGERSDLAAAIETLRRIFA
jgi:hypothetical protein